MLPIAVTEIPAVLLVRCPGCAQLLEPKTKPCAHCGLGAATVPTFWAERKFGDRKVGWQLVLGAAMALVSSLPMFTLWFVQKQTPALVAMALLLTIGGALGSGFLIVPAVVMLRARRKKRAWWTYATEWSSDMGHGSVEAQMVVTGDQLTWASGRYLAWGQPRGRRFGMRAAPLKAQRRFIRWLTGEVLAGRAHVANRRTIQWELKPPPQGAKPEVKEEEVVRTEETCLMVAASAGGAPDGPSEVTIYTNHLSQPRPVTELWFALSRQAKDLPEVKLLEHEIPDWAHDLEAALTAEVAPLVMN
jgi:hypothetical protein